MKGYRWIYLLIPVQLISATLALLHHEFIFKSGTAAVAILILLLMYLYQQLRVTDMIPLILAFTFSIVGDWFLSHRNEETIRFIYGIVFFFFAHVGYLWYALLRGTVRWRFTVILLMTYLLFFLLMLYPKITDKALMFAVLAYLIISTVSLGAALGIDGDKRSMLTYSFGIALILFSDTIIALREFVGYPSLDGLILPTYYLSHIFIACSVLIRQQRPRKREPDETVMVLEKKGKRLTLKVINAAGERLQERKM